MNILTKTVTLEAPEPNKIFMGNHTNKTKDMNLTLWNPKLVSVVIAGNLQNLVNIINTE